MLQPFFYSFLRPIKRVNTAAIKNPPPKPRSNKLFVALDPIMFPVIELFVININVPATPSIAAAALRGEK